MTPCKTLADSAGRSPHYVAAYEAVSGNVVLAGIGSTAFCGIFGQRVFESPFGRPMARSQSSFVSLRTRFQNLIPRTRTLKEDILKPREPENSKKVKPLKWTPRKSRWFSPELRGLLCHEGHAGALFGGHKDQGVQVASIITNTSLRGSLL